MPEGPPIDAAELVRSLVEGVLKELDLAAEVEVEEDDDAIHVEVSGDDLGLLIGRHGQMVDALQLLCYQAASRARGERVRVVVDAAGYRERRRQSLERKADQAAERALDIGDRVALDPMSAAERRIVHERLRDRPGIETWSEGAEPRRYLVVAPLMAD